MELGTIRQDHIHDQRLIFLVGQDVQVGFAESRDKMLFHFLNRLRVEVWQWDALTKTLEGMDTIL